MIKSIFKIIIGVIITICLATVFFFFYASSNNLDEIAYLEIVEEPISTFPKDTFSIMTYNLGYLSGMNNNLPLDVNSEMLNKNEKRYVSLLKGLKPDFIAFQEIDFDADRSLNKDQLSITMKEGGFKSGAKAINWDKKYVPFPYWPISANFGKTISGQAIVSKYPIVKNEVKTLIKPINAPFYYKSFYLDRLIQINELEIGEEKLILLNVHLEAFDQTTRERQSKTVLELFNHFADKYPVILLGDFNAIPDKEQVDQTIATILKGKNIKRAIPDSIYQKNKNNYYTFSSVKPDRKLDYIFYNSNKIRGFEGRRVIEASDISDHIPVFMKFSLL